MIILQMYSLKKNACYHLFTTRKFKELERSRKMLLEIVKKQEEVKAKKEYKKNISKISDLDDICTVIDELIERIDNANCEFKDKFMQNLKDIKCDIAHEMCWYEEQNLKISEMGEI